MDEEQGDAGEQYLLVALRVRLAPAMEAQTQPLRATYRVAGAGEQFDLVRLDDIDAETFSRYSDSIETLVLYDDEARSLQLRYQSQSAPFSVALGSNRQGLGILDTDTKNQATLVAAPIPPITVSDWDAIAAAYLATRP